MTLATKYKANLEIVPTAEHLAHQSLELFIADTAKAIESRGVFYVAISGGYTPRLFFKLLGQDERAKSLPWDKIHLFWVDERYVPKYSQWSNYRLALDTFIDKVPIPKENIHQIPTSSSDFEVSVRCYEESIRKTFGLKENEIPSFDLIILGLGADGHIGSLFPNCYASFDTKNLACVVYVLDEKLNRITLTHPVLCAASHLIVLVSGDDKANIIKKILTSEPDEIRYPIHTLWPALDRVTWVIDSKAAKLL